MKLRYKKCNKMKVSESVVKRGKIPTLVDLCEETLASGQIKAMRIFDEVVENEGEIPFEQRPNRTQERLTWANQIDREVNDLLWSRRKEEI